MPSLPAYLRGPALVALCAAGACLVCAAAAWAQAPDLVPALPAGPAPAADPLAGLLTTLGPTGGAGAVVALVWRAWRAEADRHAEERRELRAALTAQERLIADLDRRLGRQEDRVALASDALRRALDT
jgi:hypothetical protein